MDASQTKVVQYLREAHSSERALVRVLQSQIAMSPRGSYRSALEVHLRETRDHAVRVGARVRELDRGRSPRGIVVAVVESAVAQALALGKAPLDMLRGSGGEEKVLKNAKDTCASEALEIATYLAIEQLANAVGDEPTAVLAAEIRADEERMLERVQRELPELTRAVVRADVNGDPSYDVTTTGAADAVRGAARELDGAVASEPWPGYDELTVKQVLAALDEADPDRAAQVRAYERSHKNRVSILRAIEREPSNA
jgi:ferritin-like metal-binding protein YciE